MFNYTHWYRKSLISDADVSDVLYIKVGSYVIMHAIGTCIFNKQAGVPLLQIRFMLDSRAIIRDRYNY